MNIEEERKAFNEQFGIDDANTFPAFGDGIDSSAVLKCNWLGWVRCAEQKQAEIKSLKSELAKAQAVPEGFILIKNDTKTVVAIERMVEQQVEASGMDSRRLERLDGWRIIEAAIEAQEQKG